MMSLLALHELSTLIYLALLLPQTIGFAFWSVQCKGSKLGRGLRNACHVLQVICFPFMFVFLVALLMSPSLAWWQPEQGWLSYNPLKIHAPARVSSPAWGFWVAQGTLLILALAVVE